MHYLLSGDNTCIWISMMRLWEALEAMGDYDKKGKVEKSQTKIKFDTINVPIYANV